jgi:hypothetical protein
MIENIVGLVVVSNWTFRCFSRLGDADGLAAQSTARAPYRGLERRAQDSPSVSDGRPSITASFDSGPHSHGITLRFADDRTQFGVLSLFREEALGPFTSSEIRMLTFALDAASDRFSELRLLESQDAQLQGFRDENVDLRELAAAEDDAAHYVLDREFNIVLAWTSENERRVAVTALQARSR